MSSRDKSEIRKQIWDNEQWNVYISVFLMTVVFVTSWKAIPPQQAVMLQGSSTPLILFPETARFCLSFLFTLLTGGLTMVMVDYWRVARDRPKEEDELKDLVRTEVEYSVTQIKDQLVVKFAGVEQRLPNIRELSAFFTDNKHLENHLDSLHKADGGLAWIIAKFISKKLSESFASTLTMEIDGDDYSTFAARLYPECARSIYLTSPFTPRAWFEELFAAAVVEKIRTGEELPLTEIPQHVRSLLSSGAPTKRRLVILNDEQWKEVTCDHTDGGLSCCEKYNLLREFLRINGQTIDDGQPDGRNGKTHPGQNNAGAPSMVLRFAKLRDVQAKVRGYKQTMDYAIFDDSLVLQWGKEEDEEDAARMNGQPEKRKDRKPLELIRETGPLETKLKSLFSFEDRKVLVTGEELLSGLAHCKVLVAETAGRPK
jgi:hypothetical protein